MEDVTTTTEYSFGCFRDPVVRLGDGDAKDDEREESAIKRNGLWTRTVGFEKSRSGPLRMNGAMPPRANELFARKNMDFLLILEKKPPPPPPPPTAKKKEEEEKTKIAQTNQGYSKETRTRGLEQKPSCGKRRLVRNEMKSWLRWQLSEEEAAEQVDHRYALVGVAVRDQSEEGGASFGAGAGAGYGCKERTSSMGCERSVRVENASDWWFFSFLLILYISTVGEMLSRCLRNPPPRSLYTVQYIHRGDFTEFIRIWWEKRYMDN